MNFWSKYILSTSIDEALQALSAAPGPARPVAGGTDLLLDLQQGHQTPVHTLVDISRIPEMQSLELRGERFIYWRRRGGERDCHLPIGD